MPESGGWHNGCSKEWGWGGGAGTGTSTRVGWSLLVSLLPFLSRWCKRTNTYYSMWFISPKLCVDFSNMSCLNIYIEKLHNNFSDFHNHKDIYFMKYKTRVALLLGSCMYLHWLCIIFCTEFTWQNKRFLLSLRSTLTANVFPYSNRAIEIFNCSKIDMHSEYID